MESKQLYTVLGVLSLLGTGAALLACAVAFAAIKATGEKRLAGWTEGVAGWFFGGKGLARKILIVAVILAAGYSGALFAASLESHEWNLEPAAEKYFCEIDCHIAYTITGVAKAAAIGAGSDRATAQGIFYIVSVRTRFDETTISPHRGDAPLEPGPRRVTLVDAGGNSYAPSEAAWRAIETTGVVSSPITQSLRPGESYISIFVFDLPAGAQSPKLFIETPPAWPDRIFIGGEESLFHKKVYLRLPAWVSGDRRSFRPSQCRPERPALHNHGKSFADYSGGGFG